MARTFTQLSYEQRLEIKKHLDNGISKRAIADKIGVHHSTVYREIDRGMVNGVYDPDYSEEQYQAKMAEKGPTAILTANPELASFIADLILNDHLSPDKIIQTIKKDKRYKNISISRETIYHSIDAGLIPNVTKESLRSVSSTVFNGGTIVIPKWVLEQLDIKDGDILHFEITDNNEIIYKKE